MTEAEKMEGIDELVDTIVETLGLPDGWYVVIKELEEREDSILVEWIVFAEKRKRMGNGLATIEMKTGGK